MSIGVEMKDRVDALIELLFDNTASITERDEAATGLSEFSDNRVITSLILKAKDFSENDLVLNSCGESLGAIWANRDVFDENEYYSLPGVARYGAYVAIKIKKPDWIEKYQLDQDKFQI